MVATGELKATSDPGENGWAYGRMVARACLEGEIGLQPSAACSRPRRLDAGRPIAARLRRQVGTSPRLHVERNATVSTTVPVPASAGAAASNALTHLPAYRAGLPGSCRGPPVIGKPRMEPRGALERGRSTQRSSTRMTLSSQGGRDRGQEVLGRVVLTCSQTLRDPAHLGLDAAEAAMPTRAAIENLNGRWQVMVWAASTTLRSPPAGTAPR